MPIRLRITLFGGLVVVATIALFSLGVYQLVERGQYRDRDRVLRSQAERAAAVLARAAPEDFTPQRPLTVADLTTSLEPFVLVLDADGTPLSTTAVIDGAPPAVPAALLVAAPATTTIEPSPNVSLRVHLAPWQRPDLGREGVIVAGQSVRRLEQDLAGLRAFLIIAGIVSLLVAVGAIWLVLGRALRPLKTLARTAEEVGRTHDLGRRLPPVRSNDEVALMTDSFNGMLARLDQSQRSTREALESQKRFVADASHELRTPLTTIRTNAGLLLQHPEITGEDRQAALTDIAGESERMSRLVHDLLTLARADGGIRLETAPLDLAGVMREVWRRAGTQHPDRQWLLEDEGELPVIGNRDALTQLLSILVDNAVKHTPAGGQIRGWAAERKGLALLHVADNGTGIAQPDLERIFERFYQSSAARGGGSGLGLAIARWIVSEHNGRILAYNNDQGGATFRVELPGPPAEHG